MDWLRTYLAVKANEVVNLTTELIFVLMVALIFLLVSRGVRRTRIRAALRGLLSARIWRSRSAVLDYKYAVFNIFFFPALLSVTLLSTEQVARFLGSILPPTPEQAGWLSETQSRIAMTVLLYLALEFAYWLDHYLSHRIPLLWAFHRVHHSAEHLTPLTVFRVHPMDTLFYYNIKAIVTGAVYCGAIFVLGIKPLATWEGALLVLYMWTYGHLQHSELWIVFPGWLGKVFFSPAHHQIHHSKAAIHHNTNFGMSLSLFDWLFGTLHQPTREKQHLEFGIAHDAHEHHFGASLVEPMVRAYRRFVPRRKALAAEAEPIAADAPAAPDAGIGPAIARAA